MDIAQQSGALLHLPVPSREIKSDESVFIQNI